MSDDFLDIGWEEMALIGSLSEELADEERQRRKLEKMEQDDCDCCCDPCDQPDEEPYP